MSNYALYDEGDQLKHCVGSYAYSCLEGRCTIWSYSRIENSESKKLLTIEMNSENVISQVRGARNRFPTLNEMSHIKKWALVQKLSISQWIVDHV